MFDKHTLVIIMYSIANACVRFITVDDVYTSQAECCEMGLIALQRSMQTCTSKQLDSKEGGSSFVKRLEKVDFKLKGWP